MKNINIKNIIGIGAIAVAMLGTSCDFEKVNTNQFEMTEEQGKYDDFAMGGTFINMQRNVFPVGTQADGTDIVNQYQIAYHLAADVWSGYFGQNNNWNSGNNNTTNYLVDGWISASYRNSYANILPSWKKIKDNYDSDSDYFALAQILKISAWHKTTDMFGPIPYSHAGEPILVVPYDSQADVYDYFLKDLESAIADASAVEKYNRKKGTNYKAFDTSSAILSNNTTSIKEGALYTENTEVQLSNLGTIEEGESYVLPIKMESSDTKIIEGSDIVYFVLSKPVRIKKAWSLNSNYIRIPVLPTTEFKSVTYEALIHINRFGGNNTIMGNEGVLIFRIGDLALPGGANDLIQIAGNKQYHAPNKFSSQRWYHVAFTYDQPTGNTAIYINGAKAAESNWDTPSFDLSPTGTGFFVGKVAGFMWGERPFYGYMSEVRLWNSSRTENQIKQNMLNVNPNSDGLVAYYKLNGEDQYEENGKWYIRDISGNNMHGLSNGGNSKLNFVDLDGHIEIK